MSNSHDYLEQEPSVQAIEQTKGWVLLEFGAPWCQICQAAAPLIERVLANKYTLDHIKLYDGKGKRLGRAFKIKQWPSLILLQDGKEVTRIVRPTTQEQISEWLNLHL